MRIIRLVPVLAALLFLPTLTWSQTEMPEPLGAEVPPLTTTSEIPTKNVLELSLRLTSYFDDNALGDNLNKHSDTSFDATPTIDFKQELERLKWDFFYSPGFTYNQHFSDRRYFSQLAGGQLAYQLFKHVELKFHGDGTLTTNPFEQLDRSISLPQGNVIDRPNTSVILPKTKQIEANGGLGVDWFESAFTTISLSGDITDQRYRNLAVQTVAQQKLIDTRTIHGHGAVLHRISARQTVGVMYDYQDLGFPVAHARTTSHAVEGFDEFAITPNMKLTLFGGPEYSREHDQVELNLFFFTIVLPTFKTMWSPTAGAQYSWQGSRNALRAGYIHKISDGGGLIGAVTLDDGNVEFRRQLTRRWTFDLDGYYANNNSLGFAGSSRLRAWAANSSIERAITPNLSVSAGYSRLNQRRSGLVGGAAADDDNRVLISLRYRWDYPLGR